MAAHAGPDAVESGLVLHLDAGNTKSYPGTGATWTDLSGNGNSGTLTNGPTYSSANNGYIRCDGSDDFIEIADASSLDFGSGNFTVEYWFKKLATTSGYDNIWGPNKWNTGASPGTNEWTLGIGNGSTGSGDAYVFGLSSGTTDYLTAYSTSPLSILVWYQLAGIREGATLKTYLNGVITQSVTPAGFTSSTSVNNVGRPLRINNSSGNFFYSNVDNGILRIYNRALSAAEIKQNFNSLRGRYGI